MSLRSKLPCGFLGYLGIIQMVFVYDTAVSFSAFEEVTFKGTHRDIRMSSILLAQRALNIYSDSKTNTPIAINRGHGERQNYK